MINQQRLYGDKYNRLYLCAPVNALVEGIYEENIHFSEIRKHGDFGLGTFDKLDGEMVMLDGKIYHIHSDGSVRQIGEEDAMTPFSCVVFFKPLSHDSSAYDLTYEEFLKWLGSLMPSPNIFYAFRIEGTFSHMTVRSVTKQEYYLPLAEAAKKQAVFDYPNTEGTLAGFFTPSFMASLSVPGIHLHYLSSDFQTGGHLLHCSPKSIRAEVQFIRNVELSLPASIEYLTRNLERDVHEDLGKAERLHEF